MKVIASLTSAKSDKNQLLYFFRFGNLMFSITSYVVSVILIGYLTAEKGVVIYTLCESPAMGWFDVTGATATSTVVTGLPMIVGANRKFQNCSAHRQTLTDDVIRRKNFN